LGQCSARTYIIRLRVVFVQCTVYTSDIPMVFRCKAFEKVDITNHATTSLIIWYFIEISAKVCGATSIPRCLIDIILSRLRAAIKEGIHAIDPFLLQWRLNNHNIRNANQWSIKYNVCADLSRLRAAIKEGIHAIDPFLLQWRLNNHNIRNANQWSIKYNVYADQH
jgi:hypothetical protein